MNVIDECFEKLKAAGIPFILCAVTGGKDKDYKDIIGFYLFKICDSIYKLDIEPYKAERLTVFHQELESGIYENKINYM